MERKFTTQDVANQLGNAVAVMATSAFNLIGAGATMYTLGVYLDNAKAADVKATINGAMETLGYKRSSKFELASACMDLARDLIKAHGRPDTASPSTFWLGVVGSDNASDAIALVIADMKARHQVDTVQGLYLALKGEAKAKAPSDKTVLEKVLKAMEGASGDDTAAVAMALIPSVMPSDAKAILLALASKLTVEELNDCMASMVAMVTETTATLAKAA